MSESGTGDPTAQASAEQAVDAADAPVVNAPASWAARHPALTYTLARFALFALLFVILMVVIQNLFVALITAAIVSSVVSVFALRKQRDALSASIATRAERANQKMAERSASEDSWDEAQRETHDSASESEPVSGSDPGSGPGSDSDSDRL